MKKMKWEKLWIAAGLLAIPLWTHAQLVKGVIKKDSIESFQIAYSPDGNTMNLGYQEITPAADGSFTWDINLLEQTNDIGIYVDNEIFGARVEQGKTIVVNLTQNKKKGTMDVRFEGDNATLSRSEERRVGQEC